MVLSDTLIIKHLPNVLNDKQKESLLQHFGAKEVKCISSKRNKYNIAFARFESEKVAEDVLHRLHQSDVLGASLAVEFAQSNQLKSTLPEHNVDYSCTKVKENEEYYKQFIEKLTSWHTGINFKQPVPSHLKYQYPPPNIQTLINIIKVLATVPKFYTQVLHLMNKMNLPCPFGKDILPEYDIEIGSLTEKESVADTQEEPEKCEEVMETSESEISSDEGIINEKKTVIIENKVKKKMKIKLPKFVRPVPATSQKPKKERKMAFEEVFEKVPDEKEPKKIKLSHSFSLSEGSERPTEELTEKPESSSSGFGYIHPVKKVVEEKSPEDIRDEREEERLEREEIICISEAELAQNRIPEKDRSILPVFKNYAEGAPTCRLYIKNVAKTVTQEDLKYIYHRYLSKNIGGEPNTFDIRLMQEGRMKGQAFITLQTVELAQKALKETNGYILKEKPLVVQFARSATK